MGVRINGVWHEELADPGTGGSDEGGGRNFDSPQQYNQASAQLSANNAWGENLNTVASTTAPAPGAAPPVGTLPSTTGGADQYGDQIEKLLAAVAAGNAQAFAEAVREFDLTHGLDTQKFQDDIRRFNENLAISQAGLTGTYQGAPTLAGRLQQATLYGTETPTAGQQTLAAQQQQFTQQQALAEMYGQGYGGFGQVPTGQQTLAAQLQAAQQLGTYQGQQTLAAQQQAYAQQLGAINAAAALQANPFRQAEVMGQVGALLRGNPVAGFQAPGATSQTDFSGLGNMQRLIDDIRAGTTGGNSVNPQSVLNAIPTPNKVDSKAFMTMAPEQQQLVLSGIQQKYGLSPENALAQIKATLPAFSAPATFGRIA